MIEVTLKDGSKKSYQSGTNVYDIAKDISQGLARAAVAAEINGKVTDLNTSLYEDCTLNLLTFDSEEGKATYWHTASHIMAQAVKRLFPNVKLAIGPSIENGFYYDFDSEKSFTPDDLTKIEAEMKKIIKEDLPIERFTLPRDEALKLMENEPYKIELINELPVDAEISFYKQGEFTDLCSGPHLPSTGKVKAFKLIQQAGAYWRGDEKNKMLQRIYGIAFPKASQLEEYLKMLEEAEKRDHRKLGKELELFSFDEEVGPGLVLWHPKGARVRMRIEDFWRQEHIKNGYDIVYTPHIGRGKLWETSGHLGFYKEGMYSAMDVDGQDFYAKPMNCPFHIAIYKSRLYSYRDLPLRWAELGTVYRYEKSGTLHGLLRVRGFTQDDAHLFCAPEQMPDEIRRVLRFCLYMLDAFGFDKYKIYLSTKPKEKYVGDDQMWADATKALKEAVIAEGLECDIDEGGGAFYGPKIDIKIKDALNREWQCSTIQFDFNEPERFDMTYVAPDGTRKRPYMIHRALLGSIERFFGVLTEHYAGAFPVWLAPVQVKILPILESHHEYANKIAEKLQQLDVYAEVDLRNEKIGYKIREARLEKIPYMLIIGDKEVENQSVSVRSRKDGDLGAMNVDAFISKLMEEIRTRAN
ncbi:MAG: threonine--tRNA ligase [Clostridiaceae bacterium]|nr:threonine--tRNA ligase [Clostridiaceae bacterium]